MWKIFLQAAVTWMTDFSSCGIYCSIITESIISHTNLSATGTQSFLMIITLNCCILSDDPSHVFSLKIDNNKNVSVLRKAIKDEKKPAFDSITANRLNLWNVSIKINDNLPEKLREHSHKKALCLTKILSDVFPNGTLAVNTLHIVIDAPPGMCHTVHTIVWIFIWQ